MEDNAFCEFSVCDARSDAININAHAEVQKNEVLLRMVMAQSESAADERTYCNRFFQ